MSEDKILYGVEEEIRVKVSEGCSFARIMEDYKNLEGVDLNDLSLRVQEIIKELTPNLKPVKYRIKKKGTTFIGNLEKGDIVFILSTKEGVAYIDNGYAQDYIMVEDLEEIL